MVESDSGQFEYKESPSGQQQLLCKKFVLENKNIKLRTACLQMTPCVTMSILNESMNNQRHSTARRRFFSFTVARLFY